MEKEKCKRCGKTIQGRKIGWFDTNPYCDDCFQVVQWKARIKRGEEMKHGK